jgi:hypothetical protein
MSGGRERGDQDPFENWWFIATHLRSVPDGEQQQAMRELIAANGKFPHRKYTGLPGR